MSGPGELARDVSWEGYLVGALSEFEQGVVELARQPNRPTETGLAAVGVVEKLLRFAETYCIEREAQEPLNRLMCRAGELTNSFQRLAQVRRSWPYRWQRLTGKVPAKFSDDRLAFLRAIRGLRGVVADLFDLFIRRFSRPEAANAWRGTLQAASFNLGAAIDGLTW